MLILSEIGAPGITITIKKIIIIKVDIYTALVHDYMYSPD